MILSRASKRIVARIAAITLLLYVTAFTANACVLGAPGPHDHAAIQPCQETGSGASASAEHDFCQMHYSSEQLIPGAITMAALVTPELPASAARLDHPLLADCATPVVVSLSAPAKSLPLSIIYCRLLN